MKKLYVHWIPIEFYYNADKTIDYNNWIIYIDIFLCSNLVASYHSPSTINHKFSKIALFKILQKRKNRNFKLWIIGYYDVFDCI